VYRKQANQILLPHEFFLPFEGHLNEDNRWVQLTFLIPWHRVEEHYAGLFQPNSHGGQMAVSVRMALGSLIIQQKLRTSDEETVVNLTENPYLQYLIGLERFQQEPPFDASLMTHFRKRLGPEVLNQVNEWIVMAAHEEQAEENDNGPGDSGGSKPESTAESVEKLDGNSSKTVPRQGKLLLDATCTPADIAFPTDLSLLNEAREKLEDIIDLLYAPHRGTMPKPRTYRRKARQSFLTITKQRRASQKKIRKGVGQQLRYVARDLRIVERLSEQTPLTMLGRRGYKNLLVIQELFRQQRQMYEERSHRIEDRIVNLSQPHIRPIVRGKAKAAVEFGAKMAMSMVDGYARIEQVQWDPFNEGQKLQETVEAYRDRYGYYPEAVLADKLYRTRENLQYCKELGIRLSGPKLGRPRKNEQTVHRKLERQDAAERNAIEGKFGEGKRHYGLDLIRARLPETSLSVISLQILVMNLERRLRLSLVQFLFSVFHCIWPVLDEVPVIVVVQ
jgi:IS5 family transposase